MRWMKARDCGTEVMFSAAAAQTLSVSAAGITRFEIPQNSAIGIDDFTFTPASVPEPPPCSCSAPACSAQVCGAGDRNARKRKGAASQECSRAAASRVNDAVERHPKVSVPIELPTAKRPGEMPSRFPLQILVGMTGFEPATP